MAEETEAKTGPNWMLIVGVIVVVLGLLVCFGGVCVIGGLTTLGSNLQQTFEQVATEVGNERAP